MIQPYVQWSRAEKLALRRLYLIQGLSPKEISVKLNREPHSVQQQVHKQGWAKLRREKVEQAATSADQDAAEGAREFMESVAINSQELTEKAFGMAHATRDAKDMMFLSSTVKNFYGVAKNALGLDAVQALAGGSPQLALIVTRPMKNVTETAIQSVPESDELDFA